MMRYSFVILKVFLFTIFLTASSSALRLNEIESNPEGDDAGFEWVELYSDERISLDGYVLDHEGRGSPINLSGEFQGFFIISFQTQWLRNSNETVYLRFQDQIIDTSGAFSDNKVDKTYNFCDGSWKFADATKEAENNCATSGNSGNSNNLNNKTNLINKKEKNETKSNQKTNNLINETVNLVSHNDQINVKKIVLSDSKDEKNNITSTRTYKVRIGVIYFFIGFCVLLIILIAMKKL